MNKSTKVLLTTFALSFVFVLIAMITFKSRVEAVIRDNRKALTQPLPPEVYNKFEKEQARVLRKLGVTFPDSTKKLPASTPATSVPSAVQPKQ